MCDCEPTSAASIPYWLVLARAAHLGACLVLFGFLAFERLIAGPVIRRGRLGSRGYWTPAPRRLVLLALPAALLSGVAWLVLVAGDMNECTPGEALHLDVLRVVWDQTHFGRLWQLRSVFWLVTTVLVSLLVSFREPSAFRSALIWAAVASSGGLLGSLAWAGHGLTGTGTLAPWHLPADGVHLLVSGLWPAGLLPFGLLLFRFRKHPAPDGWLAVAGLTRRFSAMSLASVALLTATGLVNSWLLVGSFAGLTHTPYGKCLLLKIAFFVLMLALGSVNLLFLKPRLAAESAAGNMTAARLRFNVVAEFVLGTGVIVAVAVLGVLRPGMPGME